MINKLYFSVFQNKENIVIIWRSLNNWIKCDDPAWGIYLPNECCNGHLNNANNLCSVKLRKMTRIGAQLTAKSKVYLSRLLPCMAGLHPHHWQVHYKQACIANTECPLEFDGNDQGWVITKIQFPHHLFSFEKGFTIIARKIVWRVLDI